MRIAHLALTCCIAFGSISSQAATGMCEDASGGIAVSILTNDRGELLDLSLTIDNAKIVRFPEANNSSVELPSHRYRFSVKKDAHHDALELDILDKSGKMKYHGKTIALECSWL